MKTTRWVVSILVVGLLGLAACSKAQKPPEYMEVNGHKIELPKLQDAFTSANPEQKDSLAKISSAVRYGKFEEALMELDKLSNDVSLTEPQKKVVVTVLGQVKDVLTKASIPPAK
jgi:hypothetical protein